MHNTVKGWVKKIKFARRLCVEYLYDYLKYFEFNASIAKSSLVKIEAEIIAKYHVIEKGLSHPNPKPIFALQSVNTLVSLVEKYDAIGFARTPQLEVAVSVLCEYVAHSVNLKIVSQDLKDRIRYIAELGGKNPSYVGRKEITKDLYFSKRKCSFEVFSQSRFSVRDFVEKEIAVERIRRAVSIAQKSPSVCNRQTCRVHVISAKEYIKAHLEFQTGNRGFGEKINKLLIVTSDIRMFEGVQEKNQSFVDGGFFAMSLLYALHYEGLGAVPLNWAYTKSRDQQLRKLNTIPIYERVIVMIGVGEVPEKFSVAESFRRPVDEVIVIN